MVRHRWATGEMPDEDELDDEPRKASSPLPEGFLDLTQMQQQRWLYALVRQQAFGADRPTREMIDAALPLTGKVWDLVEADDTLAFRLDENDRLADEIGCGPGAGRSTFPITLYVWSMRLVWILSAILVYLYVVHLFE